MSSSPNSSHLQCLLYVSILAAVVDYEPNPFPGVLTFPEGSGPGTILRDNVTIVDDDIVEATEDFDLSASITNPSDPARFADTRDMAVGLIIDDDSTSNTLEVYPCNIVTVVFPIIYYDGQ